MSAAQTVWRAQVRSLRNAARHDRGYRLGVVVLAVVGVVIAAVSIPRLATLLEHWQAQGVLPDRLWLVIVGGWLVLGLLAAMHTGRYGIGAAEAQVLWSLPLRPASRFRALWGVVLIEGLWGVLLLQAGVLGGVLALTLGWQATPWLLALGAGAGVACWCGIASILAARSVTRWRARFLFTTGALVGVLIAGSMIRWPEHGHVLLPGWIGSALLALLLLLLGPLAASMGRLYEHALVAAEQRDRARSTVYVPGEQILSRRLLRRRSVASALLRKGLLSRGRSKLNVVRFAAPAAYIALFPWLESIVARYGLDTATLVGAFVTLLVLGMLSETVPSAIGGEGDRLALVLLAPVPHGTLLWAKWIAWTVPVVGYSVLLGGVLGVWRGLAPVDLFATLSGIVLVLGGNAACWVWGSAWDADLNSAATGPEQTMLLEELPLTPWRMVLMMGNVGFAGAAWLLIWLLPAVVALPLLLVVDLIVYLVMWRLASVALRRLVRGPR